MKAALISPPTQFDSSIVLPSLALGILSAQLECDGIEHVCFDCNLMRDPPPTALGHLAPAEEDAYLDRCVSLIAAYQPDVVGVSAWGVAVPFALTFGKAFHRVSPNTAIVCGGVRDAGLARMMMETEPAISAVVVGDGEHVIVPLTRRLGHAAAGAWPSGVFHREGNEILLSAPPVFSPPSTWPIPAYGSFGFPPSREFLFEGSRGCPYSCIFCCLNREPFRRRQPADLIDKLASFCTNNEVRTAAFCDNLIPLSGAWTDELCACIDRKLKGLRWTCCSRCDHISLPTVARMRRAGCSNIFIGVESLSPETLAFVNKTRCPLEYGRHLVENLLAIEELGIRVRVSTIAGFPYEGFDDMRQTLEFVTSLLQIGISAYAGLPMVYPGSEMWEMFRRGAFDLVPVNNRRLFRNRGGLFASRFAHSPWFVPNRFMPRHAYLPQDEVEQFIEGYLNLMNAERRRSITPRIEACHSQPA